MLRGSAPQHDGVKYLPLTYALRSMDEGEDYVYELIIASGWGIFGRLKYLLYLCAIALLKLI